MADGNIADSHHSLSLDTLHQLPKDMQGSDSSIPLSPQWLLPKPGDIKHGMVAVGESHLSPYPGYASRSGISKLLKNGEDVQDTEKKRDVFRPSVHDFDAGRHERWRDEERDTNSAIRRDRKKDGEKEIGDTRKMERWVDNSIRHSGEPRRTPSDRWNDSNNRDANYDQRRDNKWNTRWGPDDKESESWREKLQDSGRDSELVRDKVPSPFANQGKEDKELDQHRPWRSNSFQSRGRGEPPHHQNLTQKTPTFNYGRGRGEYSPTNFSVGRGRVGSGGSVLSSISSHAQFLGGASDKGEIFHDQSPLKYSRIKLLDVYRTTDVTSHGRQIDEFFERPPSLTQTEPLEPLALSAPTPEEMVILKGIDKGDIVSSGMPQASKEGPAGRSAMDPVQLGRTKTGSREELSSASDAYKVESADNSNDPHFNYSDSHFEKYMHPYGSGLKSEANHDVQIHHDSKFSVEALRSDPPSHGRVNEVSIAREVTMQGSPYPGAPWRSESLGERLGERSQVSSHDRRDAPQIRSRTSDVGLSHLQKERDIALESSSAVAQSYYKDQLNWQAREGIHSDYGSESTIKRQLSDVMLREQEARRFLQQTSPEDLSLYYKDPQGEIQGPFSGSDLIGWFEAGYFGIDLQVRVASALPGTPFSSLGDVMPHLRAKAKAPPGFGAPKPSDNPEMINRPGSSSHGKLLVNSSEIDILRTDPRNRTEAENKFLESLMSAGSLSSSPLEKFASSEGLQGYMGNNPVGMPPMGVEVGKDLNYLLAQRMSLERQRSLPNPHSNWPGRDAASLYPKSDIISESLSPHSKLHPSMIDGSRQIPHSQNVDLISLLQGVTDKSASPVNNGVSGWSMRQDKMDTHHTQGFPQSAYGVQQQRMQAQNQQPLTNVGQPLDNSGIGTAERLLSSGLSQDPQMLSLLQQQYLMSQLQLQPQTPAPSQLSLLDKLLFLKQQQQQQQQQQQEQQQKQLLLQQHLLSQVLADKHSHQPHSEPFGHLQGGAVTAMNGPVDPVGLRSQYEVYQNNSHSSLAGVFPSQVPQGVGHHVSYEAPQLHTPHQVLGNTYHNREEEIVETQRVDRSMASPVADSTALPDPTQDDIHELSGTTDSLVLEYCAAAEKRPSQSIGINETDLGTLEPVPTSRADSNEASMSEQIQDTRKWSSDIFVEPQGQKEQLDSELSSASEIKGNEAAEVKKVSEKKSKKQKNSKSSSSDKVKGVSQSKRSEIEGSNVSADVGQALDETPPVKTGYNRSGMPDTSVDLVEEKVQDQPKEGDFASLQKAQLESAHRAWKPAPGVKAKSLLEIQQEEARVAQKQVSSSDTATSLNTGSSSLSWTGIVGNVEPKLTRDNFLEAKSNSSIINLKSKKSQLHDLLAEEVLAKSDEGTSENTDVVYGLPSVSVTSQQPGSAIDDDNFIQAKESKKGRKKSGKVKGTPVKTSSPVVSADAPVSKNQRQIQQEKEVLPAAPSGPSLGDFVLWKGEATNSSPVPAWSTDSGKLSKPTSLRDIQKEQGKRASTAPQPAPIPSPQKAQQTRGTRGNGTSWTASGSSPSKSTSPTQVNSISSAQSKSKVEDDLFWGPLDQSKQEPKQLGFPSLATPSNWGSKSTTAKGTVGGSSTRQKLMGNKPAESLPPTAQSSVKGRRDAMTKQSEAMDFRDWCESETVRLTGSKDTSFLEFCLKQSTSEAEILLIENLGSFDPDHEFIEKFLNYKELLSADVLEIAFDARSDGRTVRDGYTNNLTTGELDPDAIGGSAKGGKKKGKKGKKVNPSVLGFNVVSNRIMMGEIQTVEE